MDSKGNSRSWNDQKKVCFGLFNAFAVTKGYGGGKKWEDLSMEEVIVPEIYATFAGWLTNEYRTSAGGFLKGVTVVNYTCVLINDAKTKFQAQGPAEAKLFFTCLEIRSHTEAANWLSGMKKQIKRTTFEREKEAGTLGDDSKVIMS